MNYLIREESHKIANKLGFVLKSSKKGNYKIDAFTKTGKYVDSFGHKDYPDYHVWKEKEKTGDVPVGHAQARRKAFEQRFEKQRHKKYSRAWLSDVFLWKDYKDFT